MQIDEIHIFDETGTIVKGSVPKYFGYSVNDREQIVFLKQMLTDKSLRLCQESTPNTAEEKEMQYAAVWSEDGTLFVQVGITPCRRLAVIRKNQISYIFSLLTSKSGVILYAVDVESGEILGSTDDKATGKRCLLCRKSLSRVFAAFENLLRRGTLLGYCAEYLHY